MGSEIKTVEDFQDHVREIRACENYRDPLAFGVGIAHTSKAGNILDTFFPFPNYGNNLGSAAVMANVAGHKSGTASYKLELAQLVDMIETFFPFEGDGKRHSNIDAIKAVLNTVQGCKEKHGAIRIPVVSFIDQTEHDQGPQTVSDTYLRLHLLSHRLVKPNGINLDGIFGKLPNIVWTNEGPIGLVAPIPSYPRKHHP